MIATLRVFRCFASFSATCHIVCHDKLRHYFTYATLRLLDDGAMIRSRYDAATLRGDVFAAFAVAISFDAAEAAYFTLMLLLSYAADADAAITMPPRCHCHATPCYAIRCR